MDVLYTKICITPRIRLMKFSASKPITSNSWSDRGLNIKYIKFHPPKEGDLTEPDVANIHKRCITQKEPQGKEKDWAAFYNFDTKIQTKSRRDFHPKDIKL